MVVGLWVVECFIVIFRVHIPPRAAISSLGLAGVLELAMRLSYLRVVLSFY